MPVLADIEARITADTSSFDAGMAKASQGIDQLNTKSQTTEQAAQRVGVGLAGIGAAGIGAFAGAIDEAANFEQGLSNIKSVGGADAVAAMDDIRAAALQMGAETSFSATDAAAGMETLIKAGVPVEDAINGVTRSALDLAAAGGVSVVDAAGAMSQALNVFGGDATHTADLFAQVANASATGVNEIAAGFGNVAPIAKNFGLSMDDTAEAIGVMSNAGVDGAEAGTMLKSMLLSLYTPSKQQTAAMKSLGLQTSDFLDESGNLVGIPEMFTKISDAAKASGMPMGQVKEAMATIFGSYGITAASNFFDVLDTGFTDLETGMSNAGTAQEQAAARMDNFKGAMETLGGSISSVAVIIGSVFIPILTTVARGITEAVNLFTQLPAPIQGVIAVVGALGSGLALIGGSALLIAPQVVKMVEAFNILKEAMLGANIAQKALSVGFGPIGIALAVIGLAVVAYQTNFLGFRDAVNAVASALGDTLGKAADFAGRSLGLIAGRVQDGIKNVGDFVAAIQKIDVGAGLQKLSDWFSRTFQQAADDAGQKWQDFTNLLGQITIPTSWGQIESWLRDKLTGAFDIVQQKWADFKAMLGNLPIPQWMRDLADFLGSKLLRFIELEIQGWQRLFDVIGSFSLPDALAGIGDFLQEHFGGAIDWVLGKWNDLQALLQQPFVMSGIEAAIAPYQNAFDLIRQKAQDFFDLFKNFSMPPGLKDLGNWLQTNIGDKIKVVVDKLGEWKDALADIQVPEEMQAVASWFDTSFVPAVQRAIDKVKDFGSELKRQQDIALQGSAGGADPYSLAGIQSGTDPRKVFEQRQAVEEATKAIDDQTASLGRWGVVQNEAINLTGVSITATDEQTGAVNRWGFALGELGVAQQQEKQYSDAQLDAMQKVADGYREVLPGSLNVFTNKLAMATQGSVEFFAAMQDLDDIGVSTFSDMGQAVLDWGQAFTSVQTNLNTTLTTIQQIQGLNAGINNAQQVAQSLVGDPGVYAEVDDLLAKHLITETQYNDAKTASAQLTTAQAIAQDELNAMVVAYLPSLADTAVAQEGLISQLQQMAPAQREVALAMMDSGNQAKVAAAFSASYSGALGEIPSEVASSIILNAARADPVLANLLETYGLVERGVNGEITVTMPSQSDLVLEQFKQMFPKEAGARVFMVDGLIHVQNGSGTEIVYDQWHNIVDMNGTVINAELNVQLKGISEALASGAGFGASAPGGGSIGDNFVTSIANQIEAASPAPIEAASQTLVGGALTAVDVSADAATLATNVTGDISTGITDDTASIQLSVESVVTEAITGVDTSSDTAALATQLTGNISTGITDDQAAISLAVQSVITEALTAADPTQDGTLLGTDIITQIDAGIDATAMNVQTTVETAVSGALTGTDPTQDANDLGAQIINQIMAGIESVMESLNTSVENVVSTALTGTDPTQDASALGAKIVTDIGTGISGAESDLSSTLQNAVLGAIQGVSALSGAAHDAGLPIGAAIGQGVADGVAAALPAVRGQIEAGLSGMSVNVPVNVNVTTNVTQQLVGVAEAAAPVVEDAYYDVGAAAPAGAETGIVENMGAPVEAIASMGTNMITQGEQTLKAFSPSRVFIALGQDVAEGLTIGIVDGIPGVVDATGQMIDPLNELEADLLNLAEIAGKGFSQNFADTIINGSDWTMDAAGVVADQFGNTLAEDFSAVVENKGNIYTGFGEQLGAVVTDGMLAGGSDGAAAAGESVIVSFKQAIVDGQPALIDATSGAIITTLSDLEVGLIQQATEAGDAAMTSLYTALLNGSDFAIDAAGRFVDQFGNVLAEDFSLVAADFYDQTGAAAQDAGEWTGEVYTNALNDSLTTGTIDINKTLFYLHEQLAAIGGEDTPKAIADISLALESLAGSTEVSTDQLTSLAEQLRSIGGDEANYVATALDDLVQAMYRTAESTADAGYATGETYSKEVAYGLSQGSIYVTDAAGNILRGLNEVEWQMAVAARDAGDEAVKNLAETLAGGATLMVDAAGNIVDQFGNWLTEDFLLVASDFYDQASEAGYAAGDTYSKEVAYGLSQGAIYVTDAAGNILRGLNEVEWQMAILARDSGDEFVANLADALAGGAVLVYDELGRVTDGVGNLLASDFTLIAEDSLVAGSDIMSALANGAVGATPQVVGATVYVSDAAMAPIEAMPAEAASAAADTITSAADVMYSTAPVLADAAATAAGGVTSEFVAMYNSIVDIVNGILEQAGIAANAAHSISKGTSDSTSGGKDDRGKNVKIDKRGGKDSGKHAKASGGNVKHGDIDKNANVKIDASGGTAKSDQSGGDGNHHHHHNNTTVNVRDGRHMNRAVRRMHRQKRLAGSR